jgi:hypothetical protein
LESSFDECLNDVTILRYVLFSFGVVPTNLNPLKFEFQRSLAHKFAISSLHTTTTMISTAVQNKASTWCQQASTRKRKTSPALVDKDTNDITKCKNFFKSNEGIVWVQGGQERAQGTRQVKTAEFVNVIGSSGGFSFRIKIYVGQTPWNFDGMSKPALFQEIACVRVR